MSEDIQANNTMDNNTEKNTMDVSTTEDNAEFSTGVNPILKAEINDENNADRDNKSNTEINTNIHADIDNTGESNTSDDSMDRINSGKADMEEIAGLNKASFPNKRKLNLSKLFQLLCAMGFIIFTALFINEAIIQPIHTKNAIDLTRELYRKPSPIPNITETAIVTLTPTVTSSPINVQPTPTQDPARDEQGRLLWFKDLLSANSDVKGWLMIPDTNINYVVLQSGPDDPDYYLHHNMFKDKDKAGALYLDWKSSVEEATQNMVIYGHNMISTPEKMFHTLNQYKPDKEDHNIVFYKEHPLISFDTIYHTGQWKIFAVFITTPDADKDYFFEYRQSKFSDASDFLNFVYQIRIRSMILINDVDINENDQLLTLSTCSREVHDDYRTVIVARKVREGEATQVNVDTAAYNENTLFAYDYYYRYGGKAPELSATFEEALANGEIDWYKTTKQ